jgi:hypothetical protein
MKAAAIVLLLAFASTIHQQQHTQAPEQQHAAMMRHADEGMGFSQEKTTHHFFLLKNGGEINVSANAPKDDTSSDQIRMHLSHVAKMFSEGDFDVPMFVHDTTPPGVPVMKKLHDEIHYRYQPTDKGGKIEIETANPKALDAVHDFLRFQIAQHKTGDATEITNAAQQPHAHQ